MASDLETRVSEIAPDIYRLSTWIPRITEHGFTFNQFPLTGDEPFLFHATGLTTNLLPTLTQLAELSPTTLALMHGASFHGDGAGQLRALSDGYAGLFGAS